jgi:exosome complex component CSL4
MVRDSKAVVTPGEKLGVIEEYMPGNNTYEDDGKVISSAVGAPDIDAQNRKIGVKAERRVSVPEVGDVVEGVVTMMKEDVAQVKIIDIRGKKPLTGDFSGTLHVSQANKGYVNSIHDVLNFNDRILAKVTTSWAPYQLSTADDDLGVIYARCPKCGNELVLKGGRAFCKRDNFYEKKKVSRLNVFKGEK